MSLKIIEIPWDSMLFNRNVIEIIYENKTTKNQMQKEEKNYINKLNPFMAFTKINVNDIETIHIFEDLGFKYIETQFHIIKKIKAKYNIQTPLFSEPVNLEDLEEIIKIALDTFDTDRYSIDPCIGRQISGKRYANWIRNSFNNDEILFNKYLYNGEIVAFNFNKIDLKRRTVYGYLGGVKSDYKGLGLGLHMNLLLNDTLFDMGIRKIDTFISAANIEIFNIDMYMQYQVKDVKVVLRKIYS